ncbi:MAG TPA: two-component regulator propeller domain-containing protein [Cyclobacteriaceae bacterium]
MKSLFVVLIFFSALPVFSQHDVRFERISVEDGLSQSSVKSLVQDKYGYLWVATLDGLNKYDGNRFYIFQNDNQNPNTIPRNDIHMLFIDKSQTLWVSTSGSLSRFVSDKNHFVNYPVVLEGKPDANFVVNGLDQESDSILVLSSNRGIWNFNILSGHFSRKPNMAEFDDQIIQSYFTTDNNDTWLVTRYAIYVRPATEPIFTAVLDSASRISFYHAKSTHEIYIQTKESLRKYDYERNQFTTLFTFPTNDDVDEAQMEILKLTNGDLWVMRKEVHVFNSADRYVKTLQYISQDPFTLSSNYLACMLETRDGVVWIGANGLGLNKYSPQFSVFNYFGSFPGAPLSLSNNFVTSVVSKDDNEIYVSTLDGLDIINLKGNNTKHYLVIAKNGQTPRINKMLFNPAGGLWIATNKGLRKWNGKEVLFTGSPLLDDPNTSVTDLLYLSPNELLVATTIGIILLNTHTNQIKQLTERGTQSIKRIGDVLWTERNTHILQLNTKTYQIIHDFSYIPDDTTSFPNALIKTFFQDSQGKAWVGTSGGGLSLFDDKNSTFINFTEKHGLPNEVVYGIQEDGANNLWLSTNKGIAVFNTKALRVVRNFNTTHGLQGNEFNTNAFYQSPSGKMYFGGVNGLTAFRPEEALQIESEIPKCIITGLFINGDRTDQTAGQQSLGDVAQNKKMELIWSERNFGIEVSTLGFSYPAYTSYQYMLQGYDNSWTLIENERRVQFTNIPHGNYTLRVKAANSFGDWEKEGLIIAISIKAPVWRRDWFIAIMTAFILASIYLAYQWRTRSLRIRATELAALVEERTKKLQIQQEEIAAQNEELSAQSESMELRNTELEDIKTTLEQRVEERTTVLKKLNEELINQNTQLEQFAFITAHNIRGPVARIKGLVNLLRTEDENLVTLLTASVNNLDEVISDLSTVLSIRKGLGNLAERVELKSQLELTIQMLTDEITKVGGHIDIDHFQEVYVDGLRPYVHSIFYNLIHNALKYSSPFRPVSIVCSTAITDDRVKITVEDNGIGIDMRYAKDKIFRLYQRFHPEVAGKGFGLFLTLTQVEAMGGFISVESTLNEGTRFMIDLPISKSDKTVNHLHHDE